MHADKVYYWTPASALGDKMFFGCKVYVLQKLYCQSPESKK